MRDVAFIALGSNVGDRQAMLAYARTALDAMPDSRVIGASSIEETDPIGPVTQGPFLNQMVAVETGLAPRELLAHLLNIEAAAGRTRDVRWGPRTLDLDIVCYAGQTTGDDDLHVPHRELPNRPFWQRELAELRALPEQHEPRTPRGGE